MPFPYDDLIKTNAERSNKETEYEIIDTGIFDHNEYFDIFIEYAKIHLDDILIRSYCYQQKYSKKRHW